MTTHKQERRLSERIRVGEDIFVSINDRLCKVHDISLDGLAFDYTVMANDKIKTTDTLEIFFMDGPILYIENIPYTIVAEVPLPIMAGDQTIIRRRACARFDDLNFRQIITFNQLMTQYLTD